MWGRTTTKQNISIGQVLVDKHWGDTKIKIIDFSPDKTMIKYMFTEIDGVECMNSDVRKSSKENILIMYKPCQDS